MVKDAVVHPVTATDLSSPDFEFMPPASYELIDWLSSKYPERSIRKGQTLEDAHRYAGARELVDRLIEQRAEEIALAPSVDSGAKRRKRGS